MQRTNTAPALTRKIKKLLGEMSAAVHVKSYDCPPATELVATIETLTEARATLQRAGVACSEIRPRFDRHCFYTMPGIDALVRKHTCSKDLLDLATAAGDYFPSLRCVTGLSSTTLPSSVSDAERAELLQIADAYDAVQEARNDPRRAFRS